LLHMKGGHRECLTPVQAIIHFGFQESFTYRARLAKFSPYIITLNLALHAPKSTRFYAVTATPAVQHAKSTKGSSSWLDC
jgi:hypothetical protein